MFENLSDDELIAATAAWDDDVSKEMIECCDCHEEFERSNGRGHKPKRCPECQRYYIVHNMSKKDAKVIGIKQVHLFLRRQS
jgi:hypothetical protein